MIFAVCLETRMNNFVTVLNRKRQKTMGLPSRTQNYENWERKGKIEKKKVKNEDEFFYTTWQKDFYIKKKPNLRFFIFFSCFQKKKLF